MGGDQESSLLSSSEEELLIEREIPGASVFRAANGLITAEDSAAGGEDGVVFGEYDDLGPRICSDFKACQKRRYRAYSEVLESYSVLKRRSANLEEAKSKILSYVPGAWIENVGGMKLTDYDVPKTTRLLLIGPKGSGKSSLINRISRVFEEDKFAPERAQVSWVTSTSLKQVGDATYFLQGYMIPRSSNAFCLYDTRSLSNYSPENMETLKRWMTKGVRHGELVIRDSDQSTLKTRIKYKTRQWGYYSSETEMANFVIFVVNGLSILESMGGDNEANKAYTRLIAETFNCPLLTFKDDKPVVVVTHGDLLPISERARVRVYLGELLGIHPSKQIFDIPESSDPETELAIIDMIRYSLEHADRNLPCKEWFLGKVPRVTLAATCLCIFLLTILGTAIITHQHAHNQGSLDTYLDWHKIGDLWHGSSSDTYLDWHKIRGLWHGSSSDTHLDWHKIRHMWLE